MSALRCITCVIFFRSEYRSACVREDVAILACCFRNHGWTNADDCYVTDMRMQTYSFAYAARTLSLPPSSLDVTAHRLLINYRARNTHLAAPYPQPPSLHPDLYPPSSPLVSNDAYLFSFPVDDLVSMYNTVAISSRSMGTCSGTQVVHGVCIVFESRFIECILAFLNTHHATGGPELEESGKC